MRKFIIIFLLLIMTPTSADEYSSVWGPGEKYKIAFLHSSKLVNKEKIIYEFENLPVTEFKVSNFTNYRYRSTYTGYGNISYIQEVAMKISDTSFEYPTGGFPVILPIKFNTKSDWLIYFSNQNSSSFDGDDKYFLIRSNSSKDGNLIIFEFEKKINLNFSNKENIISPINFVKLNEIQDLIVYNASVRVTMIYTISTGTLFQMNYTVSSLEKNYAENNISVFYLSEQLDFVAIIPFNAVINSLEFNINYLSIIMIISINRIIIRKKRRNNYLLS